MDQEFPEIFLGKHESLPCTPFKNLVTTSVQSVNKEDQQSSSTMQRTYLFF